MRQVLLGAVLVMLTVLAGCDKPASSNADAPATVPTRPPAQATLTVKEKLVPPAATAPSDLTAVDLEAARQVEAKFKQHWAVCDGAWNVETASSWIVEGHQDISFGRPATKLSTAINAVLVSKMPGGKFVQVRNAHYDLYRVPPSSADELNGVEWVGLIEYRAKVRREWQQGKGWGDWEEKAFGDWGLCAQRVEKKKGQWTAEYSPGYGGEMFDGVAVACESAPK